MDKEMVTSKKDPTAGKPYVVSEFDKQLSS